MDCRDLDEMLDSSDDLPNNHFMNKIKNLV